MNCINCGDDIVVYIYKGNSLCSWCFELAKLKETLKFRKVRENIQLVKEANQKIKECKYWIRVTRLEKCFNYPEII